MGAAGSKTQRLEKALGTTFPESEHFYGLENFGNTCYANSVLQALYYCVPMREQCIAYAAQCEAAGTTEDDLLSSLCDLFVSISNQRRRCGVHAPRRFIAKLRSENELFNNQMHQVRRGSHHQARAAAACVQRACSVRAQSRTHRAVCVRCACGVHPRTHGGRESRRPCTHAPTHGVHWLQDAHEFLNYLLNECAELLEKREKKAGGQAAAQAGSEASASDEPSAPAPYKPKTWIHALFEGKPPTLLPTCPLRR
jgi:hypothetical protein